MTDATIVIPGGSGIAVSAAAALMRGAVSALAVAALLWVARRFVRSMVAGADDCVNEMPDLAV